MSTVPQVSVIMPVYNGMPYLPQAVESVLNQTFRDFELIIVNDCSTDKSMDYVSALNDKRIVVVSTEKNQGILGALRAGVAKASGEFIARLDADDLSRADRLHIQVDFMNAHPEIGLLGASCELIDETGTVLRTISRELSGIELRWKMLFKNPFVHSTVFFRRSLLVQHDLNYSDDRNIEDYVLWNELLKYTEGHISKDVLIQYRMHSVSITQTKKKDQLVQREQFSAGLIAPFLPGKVEIQKIIAFRNWLLGDHRPSWRDRLKYFNWYLTLIRSFLKSYATDPLLLRRFARKRTEELRGRETILYFLMKLKMDHG